MPEDFTAIENLLQEMLSERFNGEVTFGPIFTEERVIYFEDEPNPAYAKDEYLWITVVFQGDRKELRSKWGISDSARLSERAWFELNEVRHPHVRWVSQKDWERERERERKRLERARR